MSPPKSIVHAESSQRGSQAQPLLTTMRDRILGAYVRAPSSGTIVELDPIEDSDSDESPLRTSKIPSGVPIRLPVPNATDIAKASVLNVNGTVDYLQILQTHGYTAVIDMVYSESMDHYHPFVTNPIKYSSLYDLDVWRDVGVKTLASIPRVILESLLDGSLARKAATQHTLIAKYYVAPRDTDPSPWLARSTVGFAPCVYCRLLVAADGRSLTMAEGRTLINRVRQYVSGDRKYDKRNAEIDCFRGLPDPGHIAAGHLYFLDGKASRVLVALTFCAAFEAYLDQREVGEGGVPVQEAILPRILSYFGFARSFAHRKDGHNNGSTSWLSALVERICKEFKDPTGRPKYTIQMYPICFVTSLMESQLCEHIMTMIGGGYYRCGGFNIAPAGLSVDAARQRGIDSDEAASHWNECRVFRLNAPYYHRQFRTEAEKDAPEYVASVKEALAEEQALDEEIARLTRENQKLRDDAQAQVTTTAQEIMRLLK